jgi:hypothetical protein
MDDRLDGTAQQWPGLYASYRVVERVSGPRSLAGALTRPRDLLEPISLPVVEPASPSDLDLP